jgi:hypothetical protein
MPEFQAGPGLLLVFAELGEKVTEEQFHGEPRAPLLTWPLSCTSPSICFPTARPDSPSLFLFLDIVDWYDNEHIPLRTSSLPEFSTAARYVALDNKEPKWAAMYSISDNTLFGEDRYTKLRANRSEREGKLVASLGVLDRRVRQSSLFFSVWVF